MELCRRRPRHTYCVACSATRHHGDVETDRSMDRNRCRAGLQQWSSPHSKPNSCPCRAQGLTRQAARWTSARCPTSPNGQHIDRPLVRNPNGRQSCPMVRASDDRWGRGPMVANRPNGHPVGTSPMVVFPARQNSGARAGHKVGTGWARRPRRDKARTWRALLSPCRT